MIPSWRYVDGRTLLIYKLYGLFKYIKSGTGPIEPRPGLFSFEGRAKHDAWTRAAQSYTSEEAAKARYLEIAENTGWRKDAVPEESKSKEEKGTGLGVSVSVMAQEDSSDS